MTWAIQNSTGWLRLHNVYERDMRSGLICEPKKTDHILIIVHNETDVTLSMKMWMGEF